jgi:hypothetical protein
METTILSTIIWGVLWLFVGGFIGALIFWGTAAIGGVIGSRKGDTELGIGSGAFIGWALAGIWEIFVIIQVVIHAVTLVQLIFFPEAVNA